MEYYHRAIGVLLLLILMIIVYYHFYTLNDGVNRTFMISPHTPSIGTTERSSSGNHLLKTKTNVKRILFYTSFFNHRPWFIFPENPSSINYSKRYGCNFDSCHISYNRSDFNRSDLVVFHPRDINVMKDEEYERINMRRLNSLRPKNQLWLFFILENPFGHRNVKMFDRYFNVTTSYRLNSDIRLPYRYHQRINTITAHNRVNHDYNYKHNYAEGKTKQMVWAVSHCNCLRDQLAMKLHEHGLNIETFGRCRFNFTKHRHDRRIPYAEYKFVFAAENHLCDDYITEKYWVHGLAEKVNTIPIVFGGANYSDPRLAIPGSYIDAMKFESPKKLAEYLLAVDHNDTLFNSYFDWRKYWMLSDGGHPDHPHRYSRWLCDVCDTLHADRWTFPRKPLLSRIDVYKECLGHEQYFRKWINIE